MLLLLLLLVVVVEVVKMRLYGEIHSLLLRILTSYVVDLHEDSGGASAAQRLSDEEARSEHLDERRSADLQRVSLEAHEVPLAEDGEGVRSARQADGEDGSLRRGRGEGDRN